jgi:hypothetical protein
VSDPKPPGPGGTPDEFAFTVVSRRTVQIDRDDLCEDCRRKFALIEAKIIFGVDYPCEDCKARVLAREQGWARESSSVTFSGKAPRRG